MTRHRARRGEPNPAEASAGIQIGRRDFSRHAPSRNVSANAPEKSAAAVFRDVTVLNKQGIHARPSSQFVKLASRFSCEVFVEKDGESINGKSIMGLLMLAAGPGSKLRIVCEGEGAEQALAELVALINGKFGEE
jgi:phosphocarrier protein HPr